MSAEIRKLYTKTETGEENAVIRSIDVGFLQTIGEGRQLTFRTMIDADMGIDEQKKAVRAMCGLADAEKAQYEMTEAEAKLSIQRRALKLAEDDVKNIDERADARRAQIKVEIETLQTGRTDSLDRMEKLFRATGRQGVFKPTGGEKRELDGIERDVDKLRKELAEIDQKRESDRRARQMAITTGKQEIGLCVEQINKCRHILGLEPVEA